MSVSARPTCPTVPPLGAPPAMSVVGVWKRPRPHLAKSDPSCRRLVRCRPGAASLCVHEANYGGLQILSGVRLVQCKRQRGAAYGNGAPPRSRTGTPARAARLRPRRARRSRPDLTHSGARLRAPTEMRGETAPPRGAPWKQDPRGGSETPRESVTERARLAYEFSNTHPPRPSRRHDLTAPRPRRLPPRGGRPVRPRTRPRTWR